jgi:hypothetical protein
LPEGGVVTKKEMVVLASRATSLYLIFWALNALSYIPAEAFSLSYYAAQASSARRDYLYKYELLLIGHSAIMSIGLFMAAIWIYKCGPTIEAFLSPSENDRNPDS